MEFFGGHLLLWCLALQFLVVKGDVGISWGRQTSHKLLASSMVDVIVANEIKKVRLFDMDDGVVSAFIDSGVNISITFPSQDILRVNDVVAWVKESITDNVNNGVSITHLFVGNGRIENTTYYNSVIAQYKSLQDVIDKDKRLQGSKKVVVSIPQWTEVLKPGITKPSQADFREDLKDKMLEYLEILKKHDSPFVVNLYPLWDLRQNNYPFEFGFVDGKTKFNIKDGNVMYTNVFDLTFDKFYWALKNNGFGGIKIIVGAIGWPTDGDVYANVTTAKRFYDGFLNKTANKIGTPLYPGPIESFINTFIDEDNRDLGPRGPTDRHYGIYTYDGIPKFNIDLTLQGRKNMTLESALGISKLPCAWCVLNQTAHGDKSDAQLSSIFEEICNKVDCTKLYYGSSCNGLDFKGNISYAYNMFFQWNNQAPGSCDWNGLGVIVKQDPSTGECKFPLQILSTTYAEGKGDMMNTLAKDGLNTKKFGEMITYSLIASSVVIFLIVMLVTRRSED